MYVTVEPVEGHELERLITVLLNLTGLVHRAIDSTERPPGADGVAVVSLVAERLRRVLAVEAEHFSNEELASVTAFLAQATLLVACDLGLEGCFTGA